LVIFDGKETDNPSSGLIYPTGNLALDVSEAVFAFTPPTGLPSMDEALKTESRVRRNIPIETAVALD
jgi:hypothetical protein